MIFGTNNVQWVSSKMAEIFKFRSRAQIAEEIVDGIVEACRARTKEILAQLEEPTPRTILGTRMEDGDATQTRIE
jgi:c-di-AMP phosphodiesterase-like protein